MSRYKAIQSHHVEELVDIFEEDRVSVDESDLDAHARDHSFHVGHRPEVVVWPRNASEVSDLLVFADTHHIPIVAWGAGTSLEGNPLALKHGICVDFSKMNQIIEIRPDDFLAVVQPGVRRLALNEQLAPYGLMFAPDPGADASIGGMIANNASGTRTIAYGATKDNVYALKVVLANGEEIHIGTGARKDSSGYDLVHLIVGSEGTLGLVTEATVKLVPLPRELSGVLAAFQSIEDAMQAVQQLMIANLKPQALEYIGSETISILNQTLQLGLHEAPTLLMDFDTSRSTASLDEAQGICEQHNCLSFDKAVGSEERDRLWQARYKTYDCIVEQYPNKSQIILDVAVPLSAYGTIAKFATSTLEYFGVVGFVWGHAGDANLHVNILFDADSPEEKEKVGFVNETIVLHAIEKGGTATGEHGVGIGKRKFMLQQHGASMGLMREIKKLLDPKGLLNPGKIFPDEEND